MALDPNEYFAAKLKGVDINGKMADLAAASRLKAATLGAMHEEALVVQAVERQEAKAAENSWAGKLGLDPKDWGGAAINRAASLVSGGSRVAGQVASLPTNAVAAADETMASDDDIAAYNRYRSLGELAGPETMAKLNRKIDTFAPTGSPEADAIYREQQERTAPDRPTILQVLERGESMRQTSRKINDFFDVSSIVDKTKRNALAKDLGDDFQSAWDEVKTGWTGLKEGEVVSGSGNVIAGLARLLYNAGEAGITNPGASSEYVIENLPQLALGAFGKGGQALLATSNVGYAADEYSKGIEAYKKANDQHLPSIEERQEMALRAASLALAEQVGDASLLKGAKAVGDITTSFKQSLKNVAGAGAKGVATEGATEGFQTYQEGEISGYSKDGYTKTGASALDVYTGATIGAIAGGGLSGGGRAIAEVRQATPEHAAEHKQKVDRAQAFNAAAEANDPSPYLDPKSKEYDPARAVGVLFRHTQLDSATPEVKTENLKQAHEIVNSLEERHVDTQQAYEQLQAVNAQIKNTDPKDTTRIAQLNDIIAVLGEDSGSFKNGTELATRMETQLSKMERQLTDSRDLRDEFMKQVEPAPAQADIDTQVELAATDKAAAETVINLSMRSPESLSDVQLETLASDETNALTAPQRAHLRTMSEARVAENAIKSSGKVSQEIYYGSKKNVGIAQYRTRMAAAFASGNQAAADRQLELLGKFAEDHKGKIKAALAAIKPGASRQIIKTDTGWAVAPEKLSDGALRKNGGLALNSAKLVQDIRAEALALVKAHAELKSASALKFGVQSKSSAAKPPSQNILPEKMEEDLVRPVVATVPTKVKPNPPTPEDKHVGEQFTDHVKAYAYIRDNKLAKTHKVNTIGQSKYEIVAIGSSKGRSYREQQEVNAKQAATVATAVVKNSTKSQETSTDSGSGVNAVVPSDNKSEQQDIDTDIPPPFFKKVMVKLDVWIKDEGVYESIDVPADQALASVREDIKNLTSLLGCMKG